MGRHGRAETGEEPVSSKRSRLRIDRHAEEEERSRAVTIQRRGESETATANRSTGVATATPTPGGRCGSASSTVDYEAGPDVARLSDRYGIDFVRDGQAERVQRLESDFGETRVRRWTDEGMTVETMGKPRDMRAYRERQNSRPDAIPPDVERRNQASLERSSALQHETGPAGDVGVPDVVRRVVSSAGTSMDETVQREMESRMGEDFSDVQIHTGLQAAAAAESIDARAFTVGNHVAFNAGEYQPNSEAGKELLAHELTHVRQRNERSMSRLPEADAEHPGGGALAVGDVHVQPRLEVSSPSDPAEKEAERVASQVMRMDVPTEAAADGPAVRRSPEEKQSGGLPADSETVEPTADICPRCARRYRAGKALNCTECEEKVQASCRECETDKASVYREASATEGGQVEGAAAEKVDAIRRSNGNPLPDDTRSYFEPRFGADFSDVEVHTGPKADEAARSIDAEAFTVGSDVAFRSGAYRPDSRAGKELLAHELTHVVQQNGGAIRPRRNGSGAARGTRARPEPAIQRFEGGTVQRFNGGLVVPSVPTTKVAENIADLVVEQFDLIKQRFDIKQDGDPEGTYLPLHIGLLMFPDHGPRLTVNILEFVESEVFTFILQKEVLVDLYIESGFEITDMIPGFDTMLDLGLDAHDLFMDVVFNEEREERILDEVADILLYRVPNPTNFCDMDEGSAMVSIPAHAFNEVARTISRYSGPDVGIGEVCAGQSHEIMNDTVIETYGRNWSDALPSCPETIENPGEAEDNEGGETFEDYTSPKTPELHKGAVLDYRAPHGSDPTHGQQCCYGVPDCAMEAGEEYYYVVTKENYNTHFTEMGADATTPGTPDVWYPGDARGVMGHQIVDVAPALGNLQWYVTEGTWKCNADIGNDDPCKYLEGETMEDAEQDGGGATDEGSTGGVEQRDSRERRGGVEAHDERTSPEPGGEWRVMKGDTLWEIAREVYGDPHEWEEIADENDIEDPRKLQTRTVLELPV